MPRGGSGITFGKISVFSNEEGLKRCEEILDDIIKRHGYPEEYTEDGDDGGKGVDEGGEEHSEDSGEDLSKKDSEVGGGHGTSEESDRDDGGAPWLRGLSSGE